MLSFLGRMNWSMHLLTYPLIFTFVQYGVRPYLKKSSEEAEKKVWEDMVKARPVDPDLFNPFTPVPYHNNPELPYVFAHINMRNYVNQNHINVKDYVWKGYHNSFDHGDKQTYRYNFTQLQ